MMSTCLTLPRGLSSPLNSVSSSSCNCWDLSKSCCSSRRPFQGKETTSFPPQLGLWLRPSLHHLQGSSQSQAAPGPIAPALHHHPSLSLKQNNNIATIELKVQILSIQEEINVFITLKLKHFKDFENFCFPLITNKCDSNNNLKYFNFILTDLFAFFYKNFVYVRIIQQEK